MRKNHSKKRLLTAAVMAALLAAPGYGYAFKRPPEYVYYNGKPMVEMQILTEDEEIKKLVDKAGYTLDPSLIEPIKSSTAYWTGLIGPRAKNGEPWQIFVTTEIDKQNASAGTASLTVKNGEAKEADVNYVAQQLQDGKKLIRMNKETGESENPPLGDYGFSVITIGQYMGAARKGAVDGWWVDTDTVLPNNEQAADFVGTFRHELGHALSIGKGINYLDEHGNVYEPESEEDIKKSKATGEVMMRFASEVTSNRSWNLHLVDQNLNPAKPGMEILSAKGFAAKKKDNPSRKASDFFIVNNKYKGEDDTGRNGEAFFVGPHVTDALAGATFFGVTGVPVNGWEYDTFEGSHLQTAGMMSHRAYSNYTSFMEVELAVMQDLGYRIDREAYFGHSVYGDGKTITNTQGYFARNEEGTSYIKGKPSTVPLGIGLHIYGSRNTVTQAADILTNGTGATGVRVDGMQNTVVIPSATNIHADGLQGNGILIAYGRNQVVNQAGTVTAKGQGGTGIRFDFGSSTNGATDEYRGSYIRYKREVEEGTGAIETSKNLELTAMSEDEYNAGKDELNGPQVTEFNLTGSLSGAENAIYISRNAFVKNINIKEGAAIRGNITSDWKHFNTDGSYDGVVKKEEKPSISFEEWMAKNHPGVNPKPGDNASSAEISAILDYIDDYEAELRANGGVTTVTKQEGALRIQYNGKTGDKGYAYDAYIPDLVTNLNFAATMAYDGNITGPDNMKLNVKSGTLAYGGKADVVGVHVAKGAALLGGNYTVHDMSGKVAADFASKLDNTDKGFFINSGTIGPVSSTSSMSITGNLLSDGTLQGVAGGSAGTIQVSGAAGIDDSQVIAKNLLPDETFTVLQASSVKGSVKNTENAPYKFGMLDETGAVEGNTAVVTGKAANNLGKTDAVQAEAYGAMMAMYNNLTANGDARRNEMRPLFTLTPAQTKKALSSIASNASAKSMALAQRSVMTRHILSTRLNEAFIPKPVKVKLPEAGLDDGSGGTLDVSLKLLEPADNDIWLKFGKNWGDLKDGADYHSSTTLLGWDKAVAPNWRAGMFAGYSKTGFADSTAGNELKDTRFGLYAGYNKAGREGLVFLNYGWMRNKLRRGVMGMTAGADYHSRLLELGGEYLYDLQARKDSPWHVRPYVNMQLSRLWQNGYSETGAGVFNQVVGSKHNDYFGMGAGVEFKRYLSRGNYAVRAGVRHAFAGAEPKLVYSYMGDQANTYNMRNVQDRTHFVLSIGGETELAKGWSIGGDAGFVRGSHDKDWSCSVTVKRMW
ncbi:MAG: autotransporter domain-containing protein [Acidaminococcaceae bacterium]|nr:autotransporter domain-containing protein [Acidaminococcaceae bacterium]